MAASAIHPFSCEIHHLVSRNLILFLPDQFNPSLIEFSWTTLINQYFGPGFAEQTRTKFDFKSSQTSSTLLFPSLLSIKNSNSPKNIQNWCFKLPICHFVAFAESHPSGHGNNAEGVAGVAWAGVRLMALKFLTASGGGRTSDAIKCLNYVPWKNSQTANKG